MLLVGLTGGIASGKSVVSGILKSLGAYIIDADRIARDLVKPGLPAWHEIVERFGSNILLDDGSINRKLLGGIIFKEHRKRVILNSILHPRIFEEIDRQVKEAAMENPDAIVILDVALLLETKAYERVDVVILVCTDEELQIKRLMERNGFSREEAMERIRAQMPLEMKKRFADFIIDSSISQEEVRNQTCEIFKKLKELSKA